MTSAQALTITAAAALLLVGSRRSGGQIDAEGLDGFGGAALMDSAETLFNTITEQAADVDDTTASNNIAAFQLVIRRAEGTEGRGGYRACYGYAHTIADLSDHPAVTGEWRGERLADAMCINAGFKPGCVSSAAGAYQIIKGTWLNVRNALGLPDFSATSQDLACIELIRRRGALEDVKAGRLDAAVRKCRNEWASLPGNYAGQGQRSIEQLAGWYASAGGTLA